MGVEGCLLSWPFSTFPSYSAAINYILVLVATNTNSWWLNCAEKEKTPDINLAVTSSLDTALLVLGAQLGQVPHNALWQLSPDICPYGWCILAAPKGLIQPPLGCSGGLNKPNYSMVKGAAPGALPMCAGPFSLNSSIGFLSSRLCQSCFTQLGQHEGTITDG